MNTRVGKNKKSKKWHYVVLVIIIIIGMMFFFFNMGSNKSSNHTDIGIAKKKVKKNNLNDVKSKLVGMNLTISPYLYDGEPVDNAMNNGNAPQNLVHDETNNITFIDENTMRSKMVGSYNPVNTAKYSVTQKYIIIGDCKINPNT